MSQKARPEWKIEKKPYDGGMVIEVTKNGARWQRVILKHELEEWRSLDNYIRETGGPRIEGLKKDHKRALAAIGVFGSVTASVLAGLTGYTKKEASKVLSQLKKRDLLEFIPPRHVTYYHIMPTWEEEPYYHMPTREEEM